MSLPPEAYKEFERLFPQIVAEILNYPPEYETTITGVATDDWLRRYDTAYRNNFPPECHMGNYQASALQARLDRMLKLTQGGNDVQQNLNYPRRS